MILQTLLLFLFSYTNVSSRSCTKTPAEALAERIVPSQARHIQFVTEEAEQDFYEYSCDGKTLIVKGNSAGSQAAGLGNYLREHCNVDVSWYAADRIPGLRRLTATEAPVRREALVRDRFFLNYCTYGYSLVWWTWEEWERLIDWMALNGVNMCLAQTGQEAVWQKVWMDMGLTAEQTREYFTGPSFLAWHRMTNLDRWHGPLPQDWIDAQADLQKLIVERERSLDIQPILSSFSGHVPAALEELFPDADISTIKPWSGFRGEYQCHYLSPSDSLYAVIQKKFLLAQREFYGKDSHIYGVDPFNEIDPPTWDPDYLAGVADLTYKSMAEVDPDAVWLQMGWIFYYMKSKWTPERVSAYLRPVPQGKLLMLDYFCDEVEVYRETENFHGQDFIWSYLGNFGGNHMMSGDFKDIDFKVKRAFQDAPEQFRGIGCTLEGLGVDPPVWEFVLDRAWSGAAGGEEFTRTIADCHFGRADEGFRALWRELYETCHRQNAHNRAQLHTSRPWTKAKRGKCPVEYDNADLLKAWGCLTQSRRSFRREFRFDCVNIARQWMENEFNLCYNPLLAAYSAGDRAAVDSLAARMTGLLDDLEAICSRDPYFSLGRYLESARKWGSDEASTHYFEEDARILITTWGARGSGLTDYSARSFDGLISDYYKPRWIELFRRLDDSLDSGVPFDEKAYFEWCYDREWQWAVSEWKDYPAKSRGGAFRLSRKLYGKYSR